MYKQYSTLIKSDISYLEVIMSACLLNVITLAAKLLVNQFEVCALFACCFNVGCFFACSTFT